MLFWVVAGAMTALAAAILLRAIAGPAADGGAGLPADVPADLAADLAVYRAQLAEADRDLARGIIGPDEAGQLKTEIARRILDLDRAGTAADRLQPPTGGGRMLPAALAALLFAGAFALHARIGAPGYPDFPHADHLAIAQSLRDERPNQAEAEAAVARSRPAPPAPAADYATLMDQLRAAVAERPDDAEGLRLLARNERALGNLGAAAAAQAGLIAALGDTATADDLAALIDLYVNAAGGQVTPEADAAIAATLQRDPKNGTARFYAGLLEAQTGRPDRAFPLWRDLLENGPPAAPWVPFLRDRISGLAAAAGVDYALPAGKGPDAAAVDAAEAMGAEDRATMIAGMVDGLEARLLDTGGSAEDWAQLLTALGVLQDTDRAGAAWVRAQAALAGDPAGLETVRRAATTAGVVE